MSIKLKNDFTVDLATAHSRLSKKWRNRHWQWSELLERCSQTKYTGETAAEYARLSRDEQSTIKDVGGFVGGYLSNGVRKGTNVMYRSVATLDIDYGTLNVWDDFQLQFGFAAMLYSTHKHSAEHPRYRLVFPFTRQVTPAEYEPICRKIAADLGIDLFDDTTYELPRLFYWPSTSKDAEYVFEYQDGPACNPDEILAQYVDPFDVSSWPVSSREKDVIAHEIKKAGDPTEKPGLIGAFCRAYTIEDAIDNFLADQYERTATEGRYTYKLGSVAGGLVCYEGKFAFSHHETDPASKQLCNAFDLCRIHLYGAQDEGSRAQDVTRLPSYGAMQEFIAKDRNVKLLMARERKQQAAAEFEGVELDDTPETNDEWKADLEYTKSGKLVSNTANIIRVLENDPALAGHIIHDDFSGFDGVVGGLPWNRHAKQWTDRDDANLRVWLERNYDLTGKDKISDALAAVLTRHSYHPVRQYLNGLTWDGTPRLERLVIDYIGAEDTPINRTMTRKHFTAAVARVFHPGCKYDYCLILTGPEGAGKSTLLNIMGGEWFNDSVVTTEGKEGMDQLRRAWVIEMGELSSIKRSDVEQVKSYLTREVDIYRAAYDRRTTEHPRQCIFCGTTNETFFLKGNTGNRRFWVIQIVPELRKFSSFREALKRDRDQLWAEAVHYYQQGESLYLDAALERKAREVQERFNDDSNDPLFEALADYLNKKVPADWDTYDLIRRRAYLSNPDPLDANASVERTRFAAVEFICERMKRDVTDKEYKYLARRINTYMDSLPDWEKVSSSRHCANLYGVQRGYRKKITEDNTEDDL